MNIFIIPSACLPVRPSNNRDFKQIACVTGVFFYCFYFMVSNVSVTTARTEVEAKPIKKPPATMAMKQIAQRRPHGRFGHGLLVRARQISTLSKRRPNSDYGVSRSHAFAVGKTQGSRNRGGSRGRVQGVRTPPPR